MRKIHCGITYTQSIVGSSRKPGGRRVSRRRRRGARTQLALVTVGNPVGDKKYMTVCRRATDLWGVEWPKDFQKLGDIKCGTCHGILWREAQRKTLEHLKEME